MKNHSVIWKILAISAVAIILVAFIVAAAIMPLFKDKPTSSKRHIMQIDYSSPEGEMMHGASGWLYGMSEEEVPSGDLLSPLSPAVAVAKTPDGEQHPVGDVQSVGNYFLESGGDYLIVYLQDIFPDWYYVYLGYEDYAAKVTVMVNKIKAMPYGDKIVCCPFNECDNGNWYGKFKKRESRFNFYNAWLGIYRLIKDISPDTKIAGPGYMEYRHSYVAEFMEFCRDNDCLPEVIIWHELSNKSYYEYQENYKDFRNLERDLGLSAADICISEYGQPSDNGVPGRMIQYISDFESTKVTACLAFWRLADNFSELAADATMPASAWWLYYYYGQMRGNSYSAVNNDVKGSHFRAVTCYDPEDDDITILCGGDNGVAQLELNNINALEGYDEVKELYATISYVDYEGLGGDCLAPTSLASYAVSITNGKSIIALNDIRADRAYFITLSPFPSDDFSVDAGAVRYEAEDGKLVGLTNAELSRATPKPNYAVSGKFVLLPTGENKYLKIDVEIPEDGNYTIKLCYANGYKVDDLRSTSSGYIIVDDEEQVDLTFPNTLSYTTTGNLHVNMSLAKGKHTLLLGCTSGKVSLDFIDVVPEENLKHYRAFLNNDGRYMFVVKNSGYYSLVADSDVTVAFHGAELSASSPVYLSRGVNLLGVTGGKIYSAEFVDEAPLSLDISLHGDFSEARAIRGRDNYIQLSVQAPDSGKYAINIPYANDSEFGIHDYNVKLVERYAVIDVNGSTQRIFFRNTYSWETSVERVVYVTLRKGSNTIKIYNDNSYHPDAACSYLPLIAHENIRIYSINPEREEA